VELKTLRQVGGTGGDLDTALPPREGNWAAHLARPLFCAVSDVSGAGCEASGQGSVGAVGSGWVGVTGTVGVVVAGSGGVVGAGSVVGAVSLVVETVGGTVAGGCPMKKKLITSTATISAPTIQ